MTARLLVVLAANGLGHARRMIGVLGSFLDRGGEADITIVGEAWQREAASRWAAGALVERHRASWRHGIVQPGVGWSVAADRYRDGSLLEWEARLDQVPELARADVVVSDNLAGVLTRRPDALLAASFLWSDVLDAAAPSSPDVGAFVAHERALLQAHRPEMLCVRDLVMPGVLARTRAHPVGWMCPRPAATVAAGVLGSPAGIDRPVAVLGGRTGAADDLLESTVSALAAAGHEVLVGDALAGPARRAFDGSPAAWGSIAAAVCRPGTGTLTDCVRWQVPMVCLDEGGNVELAHNSARMEQLGFGVDAGRHPDRDAVVASVDRLLEPSTWVRARRAMAAADRDGLDEAADWLAIHCRVTLRTPADQQGETT